MKILLDTHTHTLASTHAYSTVLEMAKYASEAGNGGKKDATDCPEEIDIKAYQARTPSDHFPVKVELVFEGEEQK